MTIMIIIQFSRDMSAHYAVSLGAAFYQTSKRRRPIFAWNLFKQRSREALRSYWPATPKPESCHLSRHSLTSSCGCGSVCWGRRRRGESVGGREWWRGRVLGEASRGSRLGK